MGNNVPDLLIGDDFGKGYYFDTSRMLPIGFIGPYGRPITSSIWSKSQHNYVFTGRGNGCLMAVHWIQEKGKSKYLYEPKTVFKMNFGFEIDMLEINHHSMDLLVIGSRNRGNIAVISNIHSENPSRILDLDTFAPLTQLFFWSRLDKCLWMVRNKQEVLCYIMDEKREVLLLKSENVVGVWQPMTVDDLLVVVTRSKIELFGVKNGEWTLEDEIGNNDVFTHMFSIGSDTLLTLLNSSIIVVWRVVRRKLFMQTIFQDVISPTVMSNKGDLIALAKENQCEVISRSTLERVALFAFPGISQVNCLKWIDDKRLLVAGSSIIAKKVYDLDIQRRTISPLLQPNHEVVIDHNVSISEPENGFVVISACSNLLIVYSLNAGMPIPITKHLFKSQVLFSLRDGLLYVIEQDKFAAYTMQKFHQALCYSLFGVKGKPTCLVPFSDSSFLIGTDTGNVYITTKSDTSLFGSIKGSVTQMIVVCGDSSVSVIGDRKTYTIIDHLRKTKNLKKPVELLERIEGNTVIAKFPCTGTLMICELPDLTGICTRPGYCVPSSAESKSEFIERVQSVRDLREVRRIAQNLALLPVCDVLDSVLGVFNPGCYGMNVNHERFRVHLEVVFDCLKSLYERRGLTILFALGKRSEVINRMLSTTESDPRFAVRAMKVAVATARLTDSKQTTQMLSTLISGGCTQDAIDLLWLTGAYFDGLRLMIENRDFENCVIGLQTLLNDFDAEDPVLRILDVLKREAPQHQVVSFLIACGMYAEAGAHLKSLGDSFTGAVLQCIKKGRCGDLYFDYTIQTDLP